VNFEFRGFWIRSTKKKERRRTMAADGEMPGKKTSRINLAMGAAAVIVAAIAAFGVVNLLTH
jgi:hypothetical protein